MVQFISLKMSIRYMKSLKKNFKKMNASKEQIRIFLLKYFDKSKEKPLRIG